MSRFFNIVRNVNSIWKSISSKAVPNSHGRTHLLCSPASQIAVYPLLHDGSFRLNDAQPLHTSCSHLGLMEFFDDEKNWSENEVKVGRAWNKEELRIKSNKDLHQLWYILLKERNMLLTMEHECNDKMELFPSPERLDKVNISMRNLETVVRERNKAYHLLETGETGERPTRLVSNPLGIKYTYKYCEHVLPPFMNMRYIKSHPTSYGGRAVYNFLLKYREKLYNEKRKAKNRSRNEVMMLLRRNPNLDNELMRRKFPNVDIDKLRKSNKIRGHFVPNVEE